jgi:hypothetical protein
LTALGDFALGSSELDAGAGGGGLPASQHAIGNHTIHGNHGNHTFHTGKNLRSPAVSLCVFRCVHEAGVALFLCVGLQWFMLGFEVANLFGGQGESSLVQAKNRSRTSAWPCGRVDGPWLIVDSRRNDGTAIVLNPTESYLRNGIADGSD